MILFTDSVNWNGEDRKRESKFEQFKCGVLNTSTAQPGHMGHAGTESAGVVDLAQQHGEDKEKDIKLKS